MCIHVAVPKTGINNHIVEPIMTNPQPHNVILNNVPSYNSMHLEYVHNVIICTSLEDTEAERVIDKVFGKKL